MSIQSSSPIFSQNTLDTTFMQYVFKKLVMLRSLDIMMLTFFTNLKRWRLISLWRSSGKFSKSTSSFTPLVAAQLYRSACRTCLHNKPIIRVRLLINPALKGPFEKEKSFMNKRDQINSCKLLLRGLHGKY